MGALDGGGSAVRVIARAKSKSDQAALALGRLWVRLRFVEGANPNAIRRVGDPGDSIDDEEVVVDEDEDSLIFYNTMQCIQYDIYAYMNLL